MTSSIIAQGDDQSHQNGIQGHCSQCLKVWTLDTGQGVCQWCGKLATCQSSTSKPRRERSRRRKREQNTRIGKGYDQLPEPHLTYYKVASRFTNKAMLDDQQDLLHDIIYHLAKVEQSKPLTEAAMYRTASHVKDHYWYDLRKRTSGLDCGHCSKTQRRKCKDNDLYTKCPKAIKLESLNKPILDSEGNITELGDLIADDRALDLDAWLDAKTFIHSWPQRLKGIARKLRAGIPLDKKDQKYLERYRRQEQIKLF
jgi:uncharacterized Zn finger protein (UPF0148 family)